MHKQGPFAVAHAPAGSCSCETGLANDATATAAAANLEGESRPTARAQASYIHLSAASCCLSRKLCFTGRLGVGYNRQAYVLRAKEQESKDQEQRERKTCRYRHAQIKCLQLQRDAANTQKPRSSSGGFGGRTRWRPIWKGCTHVLCGVRQFFAGLLLVQD